MPSVSVPLKDAPGWDALMRRRREFWKKPENNKLTAHFVGAEFACHDGSYPPINARPGMVKLCKTFLEPLRAKFGTAVVLSGYRHTLYNARIGGARQSQHIYEESFESVAADMRFAERQPDAVGGRSETATNESRRERRHWHLCPLRLRSCRLPRLRRNLVGLVAERVYLPPGATQRPQLSLGATVRVTEVSHLDEDHAELGYSRLYSRPCVTRSAGVTLKQGNVPVTDP